MDEYWANLEPQPFFGPLNTLKSLFHHTTCLPCSDVNGATSRPQQTTTNAAQLPTTLPSLGPGGVGHGRTSRPCNPVSARRARGLANASESQESRLLLPPHAASCTSPPPRQAAVARSRVRRGRTDVSTSQTCAYAERIGAGNTPKSPKVGRDL